MTMSDLMWIFCLFYIWADPIQSQAEGGFILATDTTKNKIYKLSLDDGNLIQTFDAKTVPGVYYDDSSGSIYWTDYYGLKIVREPMNNSNLQINYRTGLGMPERVTMDTSTGHLYYTAVVRSDTKNASYIAVLDPKRNAHKTLIVGLNRPRAIALYPSKGLMFWTDYGMDTSHIGRAYMDGTNWSFISNHTTNPHGLAIDFKENRIYWADAYLDHIVSTDLYGNKLRVLLTDKGAYVEDISIQEPFLYYTTSDKNEKITKIVKSTGLKVPWINVTTAKTFGRLQDIDITPKDAQPVNAQCKDGNGACSTFCLPTPTGYSCACPDKIPMTVDGLTCQGVVRCQLNIPNGKLSTSCLGFPNDYCDYSCNEGYVKPARTRRILCLNDGDWSISVPMLCQVDSSYVPPSSIDVAIKLAGALGGTSLFISIIAITLLVVYICTSNKRKSVSIERIENASAVGYSSTSGLDSFNHAFENNVYTLQNNDQSSDHTKPCDL